MAGGDLANCGGIAVIAAATHGHTGITLFRLLNLDQQQAHRSIKDITLYCPAHSGPLVPLQMNENDQRLAGQ